MPPLASNGPRAAYPAAASYPPAPAPASPAPISRPSVAGLASALSPRDAVTHAPYRREPYVRCRTPSSAVIDGKAAAWTATTVLLHWIDDAGRAHNRWVPAGAVHRLSRDDSAWQDPYDDWSFYYPENPAVLAAAA